MAEGEYFSHRPRLCNDLYLPFSEFLFYFIILLLFLTLLVYTIEKIIMTFALF